MPEPTVPTPSDPTPKDVTPEDLLPKPRGKSGFDPSEYEAQLVDDENMRVQELPPRRRMYKDVLTLADVRFIELADKLYKDEYKGKFIFYNHFKKGGNILNRVKEAGILILDNNENRWSFPVPIESTGSDSFMFGGIQLPKEGRSYAGPYDSQILTVSINLRKNGEPYVSEDDIQPNEEEGVTVSLASTYFVVLSPERDPVVIQLRHWDSDNITLSQKLAKYPRHELTDKECTAILTAIMDAPL